MGDLAGRDSEGIRTDCRVVFEILVQNLQMVAWTLIRLLHTRHRGVHKLFFGPPEGRDALEGEGPQTRPQKQLDRRLEEVAEAVGGGYCRLQMPLRLALGVRGTAAGHRLGAL